MVDSRTNNSREIAEKTYETEDSLLYDLAHYDGSIELTTWLDDLFGDG